MTHGKAYILFGPENYLQHPKRLTHNIDQASTRGCFKYGCFHKDCEGEFGWCHVRGLCGGLRVCLERVLIICVGDQQIREGAR